MQRSEVYLMQELRSAQKQLVAAKKRRNNAKILQFHIAELQKENAAIADEYRKKGANDWRRARDATEQVVAKFGPLHPGLANRARVALGLIAERTGQVVGEIPIGMNQERNGIET